MRGAAVLDLLLTERGAEMAEIAGGDSGLLMVDYKGTDPNVRRMILAHRPDQIAPQPFVRRVGYSVSFVPFKNGKPAGVVRDFAAGWMLGGRTRKKSGVAPWHSCSCAMAACWSRTMAGK